MKNIQYIKIIVFLLIMVFVILYFNNFSIAIVTKENNKAQLEFNKILLNNKLQITNANYFSERYDLNKTNSLNDANLSSKYIDTSIITDEYKEYMKLSDEEKDKVEIIPEKHPVSMKLFEDEYVKSLYNLNEKSINPLNIRAGAANENNLKYDLRTDIRKSEY